MAKSGTVNGVSERAGQIVRAVDEMHQLLAEKNVARGRIRALVQRVKKELDIAPGDFVMGVRLHALAKERRESTLANIREIMFALGEIVPQISKAEPPAANPIEVLPKIELVFQTLSQHGAMSARQLHDRLPEVASVTAHLSHLKRQKRVLHIGNMWSAKL